MPITAKSAGPIGAKPDTYLPNAVGYPIHAAEIATDLVSWNASHNSITVSYKVTDTMSGRYRLYMTEGTDTTRADVVASRDYLSFEMDLFRWDELTVEDLKDNTKYTCWLEQTNCVGTSSSHVSAIATITTKAWKVFDAGVASVFPDLASIEVYFPDYEPGSGNWELYLSSASDQSDRTYVGKSGGEKFTITGLTPDTNYRLDVRKGQNSWQSVEKIRTANIEPKAPEIDGSKVSFGSVKGIDGQIELFLTPTGSSTPVYVGNVRNYADGRKVSKTVTAPKGGELAGYITVNGRTYMVGTGRITGQVTTKKPQITSLQVGYFAHWSHPMYQVQTPEGGMWYRLDPITHELTNDKDGIWVYSRTGSAHEADFVYGGTPQVIGTMDYICMSEITWGTKLKTADIESVWTRWESCDKDGNGFEFNSESFDYRYGEERFVDNNRIPGTYLSKGFHFNEKPCFYRVYLVVDLKSSSKETQKRWVSDPWKISNPNYGKADEPWSMLIMRTRGEYKAGPWAIGNSTVDETLKAPTSLATSEVGPNTITLKWKAGQKDVSTQVFIATNSKGPFAYWGTTSETSATIKGINPGTKYWFRIAHVKSDNSASSKAVTKEATTTSTLPREIKFSEVKASSIKVSWKTDRKSLTGVLTNVYVATAKTGPYRYAGTANGKTALTVNGLRPQMTYYFRVQDVESSGGKYRALSPLTTAISKKTRYTLAAPGLAVAAGGSKAQVKLTLADGQNLAADAIVFYSASSKGPWIFLKHYKKGAKVSNKTVNAYRSGKTYFYAIYGSGDANVKSTLTTHQSPASEASVTLK
jgi:hypothetical protein